MATPRAAKPRDLEQRLRDIEAQLARVSAAAAKRPKAELSSGDLTITGGDVLMLDTDSSVLFRLGAQEFGDRGVSIYRQDGSAVLEVNKDGASEFLTQNWKLSDSIGNVIVGEWAFGEGLARPRIPMPVHPVTAPASWGLNGPEVTTTSGTYATLFRCDTRRQNPLYQPTIAVKCSDGTTSAEVQVTNDADGTALDDFFGSGDWTGTVPTGTTSYLELTPALAMPVSYDARAKLNIRVRRTAGAGTITVSVPSSIGG